MKKLLPVIALCMGAAACNSSKKKNETSAEVAAKLPGKSIFTSVDTLNIKTPEDLIAQYKNYLEAKQKNKELLTAEPKAAIEELAFFSFFTSKPVEYMSVDDNSKYDRISKTMDSLKAVYEK